MICCGRGRVNTCRCLTRADAKSRARPVHGRATDTKAAYAACPLGRVGGLCLSRPLVYGLDTVYGDFASALAA